MECKHEFIGDAQGVQCRLCGKRMTPEEYQAYLAPKPEPEAEPEEPAKPKVNPGKTRKR